MLNLILIAICALILISHVGLTATIAMCCVFVVAGLVLEALG
jgi:hypothetical protein